MVSELLAVFVVLYVIRRKGNFYLDRWAQRRAMRRWERISHELLKDERELP